MSTLSEKAIQIGSIEIHAKEGLTQSLKRSAHEKNIELTKFELLTLAVAISQKDTQLQGRKQETYTLEGKTFVAVSIVHKNEIFDLTNLSLTELKSEIPAPAPASASAPAPAENTDEYADLRNSPNNLTRAEAQQVEAGTHYLQNFQKGEYRNHSFEIKGDIIDSNIIKIEKTGDSLIFIAQGGEKINFQISEINTAISSGMKTLSKPDGQTLLINTIPEINRGYSHPPISYGVDGNQSQYQTSYIHIDGKPVQNNQNIQGYSGNGSNSLKIQGTTTGSVEMYNGPK